MLTEALVDRLLEVAGRGERFRIEADPAEVLASPGDVWTRLEGLGPVTGWLCVTDQVITTRAAKAIARMDRVPLAGEWLCADGSSVHLRHQQGSRWSLRRLRRANDPAAVGTVREMFLEADPEAAARYEVGWEIRRDPAGHEVLWPVAARFAGFVQKGVR